MGAITAWGLPATFTIAVLVTRDVDADELTGSCYVGQQNTKSLLLLVLVPQVLYHLFGSFFLLVGILSLLLPRPTTVLNTLPTPILRQRDGTKCPLEVQKRQRNLITSIGIFGWLYSLVMLCLTSSIVYEFWGREGWLRAPEPSAAPRAPSRPILQIFLLRIVATLSAGILTSSWIWWPGLLNIWRRLPPCKQPPHKCQAHVSVMHCYAGGTNNTPAHQIHHLGHLPAAQHPLLQHHQPGLQQTSRTHKKHRKHRKHHSGSETQV